MCGGGVPALKRGWGSRGGLLLPCSGEALSCVLQAPGPRPSRTPPPSTLRAAARRDMGTRGHARAPLTPVRPDNGCGAADAASALIFPKLKSAARRLRLRPPRFSAV